MVGLGLQTDFDSVEGIFDVFSCYTGNLRSPLVKVGGAEEEGRTHRAKHNILHSIHQSFVSLNSKDRCSFRSRSNVCGRSGSHVPLVVELP